MTAWALILAAGAGSRMLDATGGLAKQFLSFENRPLYWRSALSFSRSACVDGLVFVFPEQALQAEKERVQQLAFEDSLGLPWFVAPGGARRQDSCQNGLALLPQDVKKVLVHDAARPFASAALIRGVAEAVSAERPCVVPAMPVTDTIKQVDDNGIVERTLPRKYLAACQTPQGFWLSSLKQAFAGNNSLDATDEAGLMEATGFKTAIVPGEAANIKITTANDLNLLVDKQISFLPCNGFGYDVHRYGDQRPLKLGGVKIPGDYGVMAHSDGDALLHALMDALLGMAALGDIGRHFPDSDKNLEGIASTLLLDQVLEMLAREKVEICHVDLTVVAQKPKLAPYAREIQRNVANLLALSENDVNFKATTEEKMGFTGSGEGIKAYALVSGLKKKKSDNSF